MSTKVNAPTSEVLTRAADILRDGKWATIGGWPGDHNNRQDGSLCLEGGIMAALGLQLEDDDSLANEVHKEFYACPAYTAVQEYLVEKGHIAEDDRAYTYNDQVAKNKADVIRVLRTVARREKKKELASE